MTVNINPTNLPIPEKPVALRQVDSSIHRAVGFLLPNQLDSGEFATLRSKDPVFIDAAPITNVFVTAFIAQALVRIKNLPGVNRAANRAIDWLTKQRDRTGYWAFFGATARTLPPEDRFPPDLDDTACILAVFIEWQRHFGFSEMALRLLRYRTPAGTFRTWIDDTDLWNDLLESNDVDPVVNANVFHFFRLRGYELPEVSSYLEQQIRMNQFHQPSFYYRSPAIFLHALSKSLPFNVEFRTGSVGRACRKALDAVITSQIMVLAERISN